MQNRASIFVALFLLAGLACRSPLTKVAAPQGEPFRLAVPDTTVEDHSRSLKHLRDLQPGETNSPQGRKAALAAHGSHLDAAFRREAEARGLTLDPEAPFRLELTLTSLGEVRTRYIVYGILSGVAWGVGTGLATHDPRLAVALGGYELVEESVFWIAGSSLFGRYSAPVVLEARLLERGNPKPRWEETYYVIYGGKHLKAYPAERRKEREVQLHASLERALAQVFKDLEKIPGAFRPAPAP